MILVGPPTGQYRLRGRPVQEASTIEAESLGESAHAPLEGAAERGAECQLASAADEDSRVVRPIADDALGIDREPWLPLAPKDVARVQITVQQRGIITRCEEIAKQIGGHCHERRRKWSEAAGESLAKAGQPARPVRDGGEGIV